MLHEIVAPSTLYWWRVLCTRGVGSVGVHPVRRRTPWCAYHHGMPTDDNQATTVAGLLRAVLRAVDVGDLDASSPQGKRLLRRIEGAISALETQGTEP